MTEVDEPSLKQAVGRLTKGGQLAFALLLCERMIPALEVFARETGYEASIYRGALDDAWHSLEHNGTSEIFRELAERCRKHAPDTEDFSHPLTSAALNAVLSIAAAVSFLADDDVSHVIEASGLACDTAALYAQTFETTPPRSLNFNQVMKHPLVQRELRQQMDDLEFLHALAADDSRHFVSLLRGRAARTPRVLP